MEKKRFFVGNLPHEIDEDVIRSRFSKYGEVLSVELKFRYSGLDQNEIISTFAFVNLQGSQESLSACLKKLPRKKWLGKEITVEFAKESILNKLENERRAAKDNISGKTNDATKMPHSCFESNSGDLFENNEESVKIEDIKTSTLSKINFNSKSNSNILTKLENFSNVWKDCDEFSGRKITKFDDSSDFSTTVNERHENVFPKKIIGSKEKFNFLDSNKFSDIDKKNNGSESKFSRNFINADEKRLKSIKEMKKAIDQRKQTIKKALSSVDSGNLNKKIVFNDDDDDTDYDKSVDNLHKTEKVNHYDKKSKLFNDDSCDENEVLHSFDVKQQFEGDKGKKLFELQSRFGNDSRFYMDEKFYESDEEKNDNEKQDIERLEDFDEKEETINDEVKKQLKILQSIVGTEFSGQQKKQKLKHVTSATGVRYDPSVPEHEKFIVKPSSIDENEEDVKQKKSKKSKNKQKEEVKEQECVNKPSVSNETYYEVADELKKTFKSAEKTTFSFTELFNSSAEQTLQKKEEKDGFKNANLNSKKKNAPYNNFIDDRFGGDFSAEQDTPKLDEHKEVIKTGSYGMKISSIKLVILDSKFVNKALCQLLGYKQEEMLNRNLPLFHQLGNMDQVISQLEKGADWNGKISWRSKNGEYITLHCRAMAFSEVGIEATHYIYMQENPHEPTICSRGSVPSVRKGSYDVKSINSEGAQSSRRMSLARLHNLPLETPITKIITYINIVQENSSPQMNQMLDKVLDILRSTELYTTNIKNDTLKLEDPVTSDLIGALVTGPTPSHALRRSSNDSVAASALKTTQISGKPSFTLFSSPVLKELLDSSLMWDFSIFKLEETTGGRPLVYLGMNILMHFDVHKTLSCDERTLYNWLTVIERNYRSSNSYHNSTHAADVLQATAAFLEREQLKKIMDNLDEACGLIAAVCHDIDHPGMSSAFLCNSGDELAILYNDLSVLESHHAAHTFKLTLADDRINIFKALDKDVYKAARQSIIDMILATEMTKHFEHLTKFVSVFIKPTVTMEEVAQLSGNEVKSPSDNPEFIEMSPDDAILVKRMMIKCADISNPTRNVKLCVEWARRIAEEYFNQTDEEKTRNLPIVMPMFDRQSCSIPKSQMGFIDYIINDMFEAWDVFIDMPELLYNVRNNYQYWKDMEERGCTSIDKISSPSNTTILPNIPEKNSNS